MLRASRREIDKNCAISEGVFNAPAEADRRHRRVVFFNIILFRRRVRSLSLSFTHSPARHSGRLGTVCLTRGRDPLPRGMGNRYKEPSRERHNIYIYTHT